MPSGAFNTVYEHASKITKDSQPRPEVIGLASAVSLVGYYRK
jgi:hypothetical protein